MGTLIDKYDRFVFDLDGTLWRRFTPLPFAGEVMAALRQSNKRVIFLTNSGALSGREVAETLNRGGIAAEPSDVITSGRGACRVLRERGMYGRQAFVVGPAGLIEELQPLRMGFLSVEEGERASVVIVTRDEEFTYAKLRAAARAVASGALFVATNTDALYPVEDGFWPGSGPLAAAIEMAAGGVAPIVAGKPERPMLEEAAEALGSTGETLLIGDSPASDIESARRMGWAAALVLTGKTKGGEKVEPDPDYVLPHLGAMLKDGPGR